MDRRKPSPPQCREERRTYPSRNVRSRINGRKYREGIRAMHPGYRAGGGTVLFSEDPARRPWQSKVLFANVDGRLRSEANESLLEPGVGSLAPHLHQVSALSLLRAPISVMTSAAAMPWISIRFIELSIILPSSIGFVNERSAAPAQFLDRKWPLPPPGFLT